MAKTKKTKKPLKTQNPDFKSRVIIHPDGVKEIILPTRSIMTNMSDDEIIDRIMSLAYYEKIRIPFIGTFFRDLRSVRTETTAGCYIEITLPFLGKGLLRRFY